MALRPAIVLAVAVALAGCAAVPEPSLYDRVASALANRPDLEGLGSPAPQMADVSWMIGKWSIEAKVFATPTTPERIDRGTAVVSKVIGDTWLQFADSYPEGTQDLGYLTYNLVRKVWVSVSLDSTGNSIVSSAPGWSGNRLVFVAPHVQILGEEVTLRQTLVKLDADEYTVLNEELTSAGSWRALDEYRYRRARSD